MHFFRSHYKLQLHTKLFLLLIITFMIPLVILSTIFIKSYANRVKETAINSEADFHTQLTGRLNSLFESFETAGNLLLVNDSLTGCIEDYQSGSLDITSCSNQISSIVDQLSPYFDSYKPEIAIVDMSGHVLGGNYLEYYIETPQLQEYIQDYFKSATSTKTKWALDSDLYGTPPLSSKSIYGIHAISKAGSEMPYGAIVFRVKKASLISIIMPTTLDHQNFYILTDDGDMILKYENSTFTEDVDIVSTYYDTIVKYTSFEETNTAGKNILIQSNTLDSTSWHFISLSNIDQALSNYTQLNKAYYLALVICTLLSLGLSYFFSRRFTRPILDLNQQLKRVEHGDLFAHVEVKSNDEIGELSIQFNHAVEKIQKLMEQLVAEQEDKRKSDIKALQSQINPHFIFNTLTSVRYLIYSENQEKADAIIVSLNKLMKYALSDSLTMVSVDLEIEQLKNYLLIQEISLHDSLSIEIDIDPTIGKCKIMKLLLQPLVENAILHGLKPQKGHRALCIRGYPVGKDIEFVISDNGIGFDCNQTPEFSNARLVDKHSIGIANIDKRIKLYFGNKYGVEIQSHVGTGTSAYVRIPKITSSEEYHAYDYFVS